MEKLRKFNTEEEFLNIKNSLEYPQVSLTQDNGKVWVKEEDNYILAVYDFSLNGYNYNLFFGNPYDNDDLNLEWIINDEIVDEDENGKVTYKFHVDKTLESISLKYVFAFDYGGTAYGVSSVPIIHMDFSHLKTKINDLYRMPTHLTSVTFGNKFDTSLITSLEGLFCCCSELTSLDLSMFDTSNVTNMYYMFDRCYSLTSLNLSGWDTSNVIDMTYMFNECSKLTSMTQVIGFENFDTSNVTSMGAMFSGCTSLTSLDLSDLDTSNVIGMNYMFSNCSSLTSIEFGDKFDTSNVTSMSSMFQNCKSLASIEFGDKFDTSNVTDMRNMFYNCSSLTSLDLSSFNTSAVTSMFEMFNNCNKLPSLNVSNFDTSKVTDMRKMFNGCSGLTSITFGDKSYVSKVSSYNDMFTNVPSACILTLCSNTQTSWDALLSQSKVYFNGTKQYIDCA